MKGTWNTKSTQFYKYFVHFYCMPKLCPSYNEKTFCFVVFSITKINQCYWILSFANNNGHHRAYRVSSVIENEMSLTITEPLLPKSFRTWITLCCSEKHKIVRMSTTTPWKYVVLFVMTYIYIWLYILHINAYTSKIFCGRGNILISNLQSH